MSRGGVQIHAPVVLPRPERLGKTPTRARPDAVGPAHYAQTFERSYGPSARALTRDVAAVAAVGCAALHLASPG